MFHPRMGGLIDGKMEEIRHISRGLTMGVEHAILEGDAEMRYAANG